jgi:hypothetical protein
MSTVPKAFPSEFRRDVVAVARKSDESIAKVAKSFGISESCHDTGESPIGSKVICGSSLCTSIWRDSSHRLISALTCPSNAIRAPAPRVSRDGLPAAASRSSTNAIAASSTARLLFSAMAGGVVMASSPSS